MYISLQNYNNISLNIIAKVHTILYTIIHTIIYTFFLVPMTTKIIGVKELAQNLSKLLKLSNEKNIHFIVMKHGTPIANITPTKKYVTDQDMIDEGIDIEQLKIDVAEARAERGGYTTEQVRDMLGLI